MQKIKWRKNRVGVLLWLCLCVSLCGILAEGIAVILADCAAFVPADVAFVLAGYVALAKVTPAVLSVVLLALETGVCLLIFRMQNEQERRRRYRRQCRRRQAEADKKAHTPELLAVIWLLVSRVAALYFTDAVILGDTALYEAARITPGGELSLTADHASGVYTRLLSVVLKLLGNNPEAAVVVQTLLQLAAVLLFSAFVRRLFSRKASVIFLLAASVFPGFFISCRSLSPDWMICVIFGCGLLISLCFLQSLALGRRFMGAGLACLTGMLTGIGIWLDPVFIVLWLAVCIGTMQLVYSRLAEKWLDAAAVTAGAAASLAAAFFAESVQAGGSLADMLRRYSRLHTENIGFPVPDFSGIISSGEAVGAFSGWEMAIAVSALAACMLAHLAVIIFWRQEHDKTALLSVLLIGVLVYRYSGISSVTFLNMEGLLLLAAACAGISCVCEPHMGGMDAAV